jgi:hypothetical protein
MRQWVPVVTTNTTNGEVAIAKGVGSRQHKTALRFGSFLLTAFLIALIAFLSALVVCLVVRRTTAGGR